jgi:type IV pilus assembly protein PilN
MIKINLLPVRAAKKKETARQQILIFFFGIGSVAVIFFFLYSIVLAQIVTTKNRIEAGEKELQQLKQKIGEIENIKKLQDEVKKKLDILAQLRKGKTGPVDRLAALSDATPEKVWLTKYSENGTSLSLAGTAYTEDLIAEFIRKLEASKQFFNVELLYSEQTEISGIKVKKFELSCKIEPPKKEEPKPVKK